MKNWKMLLLMVFVALIGFSGTYTLYSLSKKEEKSHGRLLFQLQTQDILLSVKERIAKNKLVLAGIRSLFASSDLVTPTEWNTYCKTLDISSQFAAIEFLSIVRNIPKTEEEKAIQQIRSSGLPDFKIWPPADNPEVCPIVYIQPDPYLNWIGYDTCQNPAVYSAAQSSAEKQDVILAPAFNLSKVETKKSDFTFWLPIEKPKETKEIGKNVVYGWVMAFIRFDTLVQEVIQDVNLQDINVKVFFGSHAEESQLIFASIQSPESDPIYNEMRTINIAGSSFTFVFESGPAFKLEISYFHPRLILFLSCGAILSLLFFIYFIGSSEGALHRKITEIRGELNTSLLMRQTILDNANYSIICTDKKGIIVLFNKAAEKLLGYTADELVGKETPVFFHDSEELKTRAQLLTNLLGKPIPAGMEVFTTMADKGIPDEKTWIYVRKDQTRIPVTLSITPVKTPKGELIGYMGIAHEAK